MRHALVAVIVLTAACAAPTTEMVACPPQGCAALEPPTAMQRALLEHAELDLECPRAQLAVEDTDDTTSWVSGCGKKARYAWITQRWSRSRWLVDSPVTDRVR